MCSRRTGRAWGRSWALAAISIALVFLTNVPGTMALGLAVYCWICAQPNGRRRTAWAVAVSASAMAYCLACYGLPPSSVRTVLGNIDEVAAGVDQSSATTQELSASTQETAATAQQIATSSEDLAAQAAQLTADAPPAPQAPVPPAPLRAPAPSQSRSPSEVFYPHSNSRPQSSTPPHL